MSRVFSITRYAVILLCLTFLSPFNIPAKAVEDNSIVITAETLTADRNRNSAIFEGNVVAKTEGVLIYSDTMEVVYDEKQGKIIQIRARGDVRVQKDERVIFAEEAVYYGVEEKIVFRGDPKAVDGENVITGMEITYFFRDERTVVEGSKVVLKKQQ